MQNSTLCEYFFISSKKSGWKGEILCAKFPFLDPVTNYMSAFHF